MKCPFLCVPIVLFPVATGVAEPATPALAVTVAKEIAEEYKRQKNLRAKEAREEGGESSSSSPPPASSLWEFGIRLLYGGPSLSIMIPSDAPSYCREEFNFFSEEGTMYQLTFGRPFPVQSNKKKFEELIQPKEIVGAGVDLVGGCLKSRSDIDLSGKSGATYLKLHIWNSKTFETVESEQYVRGVAKKLDKWLSPLKDEDKEDVFFFSFPMLLVIPKRIEQQLRDGRDKDHHGLDNDSHLLLEILFTKPQVLEVDLGGVMPQVEEQPDEKPKKGGLVPHIFK
mmetsp:Transcript_6278/g.9512  ORF Transcript_6278/g.9512 Transcript_6278/m.9512 type:complete len:283 (-) Transcript_6278:59-907(-)